MGQGSATGSTAVTKPSVADKPKERESRAIVPEGPEIEQVWRTYKETSDPNLRNLLIERYLPLVRYISERLLVSLPKSIDVDDLQSAGVFGLMDAIDGFDLERGIKFKTYCTTRIRGSILDELRSQDWVPRLVRLKAHQLAKAWKALEVELGREPTDYEMAEKMGVSLEELSGMVEDASVCNIFSLSEKWDDNDDDDSLEKVEMLEDKASLDPIETLNQKDVLRAITRSLTKKEKLIIIMYYYEGLTMREIGDVLNLTESRVCQIRSNVMAKLKVQLEKMRKRLVI
ncbi:MAG: FliA/WhiG family RNA polymerase sigma factor [Planctomycetes bacterium]|nr:FliA/WhiG family RNA polymerase sigma factor [Planctomycetota bacterium]